jgi:hypothetical protein
LGRPPISIFDKKINCDIMGHDVDANHEVWHEGDHLFQIAKNYVTKPWNICDKICRTNQKLKLVDPNDVSGWNPIRWLKYSSKIKVFYVSSWFL